MPRRVLSLLAILLLVLSAQAAADDDGKGKKGKEGRGGDDKDEDRDDDRHHDRDDDRDDDREDEDDDRDDRKERRAKGRGHGREGDGPDETGPGRGGAPVVAGPRDAGLKILPTALPGRIQFSFLVTTAAAFDRVGLAGDLPDGAGPWIVSGPGAAGCGVSGTRLACSFDGLAAGEVQLVQVSAPVARASPWELVAEGTVDAGAGADAVPANDAASARIGLLLP